MYTDFGFLRKNVGDVDVLFHDGLYHLFHLVLPNHDFIAHAISEDAFNWRRVDNALFIGNPGAWDDDMLWTMHVSIDPACFGTDSIRWRMFYTGLSRRDHGYVQRVGLAVSDDLYQWEKVRVNWPPDQRRNGDATADYESCFPLCAQEPHYEDSLDEGRRWVSWRDPFFFSDDGKSYLLTAARVPDGPVIRRGCVGLSEEVEPGVFEARPPLYHPRIYDDVEVPNIVKIEGRYYLIGSIREDVKVRYWYADSLDGPWRNFFDNVLLPQGNYAARIGYDDKGPLVWNFFTVGSDRLRARNLMPPPKRLTVAEDGRLKLASFEGFEQQVREKLSCDQLAPFEPLVDNPDACATVGDDACVTFDSDGGFEAFLLSETVDCFRLQAKLHLEGRGKCGFIFRTNPDTSDGYHLSLDLIKGVAQLRAWGAYEGGTDENAFRFQTLQAGYWLSDPGGPWNVELLAFGSYLEFSVNGFVLLTLADDTYTRGRVGIYVETALLRAENLTLEKLQSPRRPTDLLTNMQSPIPAPGTGIGSGSANTGVSA
ncbi:MAG: glycosyl hydrolase [Planctomycetota bacterium]